MSEFLELMQRDESFAYYFRQISQIPRGSGNNGRISRYLVDFAVRHNLRYIQDENLNVIIYKDGSKGFEKCDAVIIQGHMDMVCERTPDSIHDFENEGLELIWDDKYIYAKDTTLGADDGIAVAYALAILADDTLVHPPLEVVITTDEEVGMDGAFGLDTSVLEAKYMLNIDSEEEGIFLTGCAGGMNVTSTVPLTFNEAKGYEMTITVSGLMGGHSGSEIGKNRSNADILMGRILNELKKKYFRINLVSIDGGNKDNAIPRMCTARLIVDERMADINALVDEIRLTLKNELKFTEKDFDIEYFVGNDIMWGKVFSQDCETSIIRYLTLVPDGVVKISGAVEGLVESSLNLGVTKTDEESVSFTHLLRSSIESSKQAMLDRIRMACGCCKATCTVNSQYPGWEYNENSLLRPLAIETFHELTGSDACAMAIHAGLECGIFKSKLPHLDIISYGPDIPDIHTTEERMDMASAVRMYDFTVNFLKKISFNINK